jgi:hypothetical protein
VSKPVVDTTAILPRQTHLAFATRQEDLDGDPVALLDPPSLLRLVSSSLNYADHLVTGNEPERRGYVTGVLLMVRTAEPAGLDTQDSVISSRLGNRDRSRFEGTWAAQYEDLGAVWTHGSLRPTMALAWLNTIAPVWV